MTSNKELLKKIAKYKHNTFFGKNVELELLQVFRLKNLFLFSFKLMQKYEILCVSACSQINKNILMKDLKRYEEDLLRIKMDINRWMQKISILEKSNELLSNKLLSLGGGTLPSGLSKVQPLCHKEIFLESDIFLNCDDIFIQKASKRNFVDTNIELIPQHPPIWYYKNLLYIQMHFQLLLVQGCNFALPLLSTRLSFLNRIIYWPHSPLYGFVNKSTELVEKLYQVKTALVQCLESLVDAIAELEKWILFYQNSHIIYASFMKTLCQKKYDLSIELQTTKMKHFFITLEHSRLIGALLKIDPHVFDKTPDLINMKQLISSSSSEYNALTTSTLSKLSSFSTSDSTSTSENTKLGLNKMINEAKLDLHLLRKNNVPNRELDIQKLGLMEENIVGKHLNKMVDNSLPKKGVLKDDNVTRKKPSTSSSKSKYSYQSKIKKTAKKPSSSSEKNMSDVFMEVSSFQSEDKTNNRKMFLKSIKQPKLSKTRYNSKDAAEITKNINSKKSDPKPEPEYTKPKILNPINGESKILLKYSKDSSELLVKSPNLNSNMSVTSIVKACSAPEEPLFCQCIDKVPPIEEIKQLIFGKDYQLAEQKSNHSNLNNSLFWQVLKRVFNKNDNSNNSDWPFTAIQSLPAYQRIQRSYSEHCELLQRLTCEENLTHSLRNEIERTSTNSMLILNTLTKEIPDFTLNSVPVNNFSPTGINFKKILNNYLSLHGCNQHQLNEDESEVYANNKAGKFTLNLFNSVTVEMNTLTQTFNSISFDNQYSDNLDLSNTTKSSNLFSSDSENKLYESLKLYSKYLN